MIGASVGQGGINAAADVTEIQTLLNARDDAGLAVDGNCGPKTIAAILAYQAEVAAWPTPLIRPPSRLPVGIAEWRALRPQHFHR